MNQDAASAKQSRARSGGRLTTVEDADRSDELAEVEDFAGEAEPHRRRWFVKPVLTSVVATLLSLGVAAGVFAAASTRSSAQDTGGVIVDHNQPDGTKAKPLNGKLDAVQNEQNNGNQDASTQFGAAGTSVNRSSVRAELSKAMTANSAQSAAASDFDTSQKLTAEQANAQQAARIKEMNEAVAKAKSQAEKIKKEKAEAQKRLAEAARNAKNTSKGEAPPVDTSGGSSVQANGQGGVSPIKSGQYTLSASFGQYGPWARYHTGQDFAASCGTPIYAVADGIVGSPVAASWAGNSATIHHSNGGSTLYAHMTTKMVSDGQMVKAGQQIGTVGETGHAFGCHLHFEYYPSGTTPGDVYSATNPVSYLASVGVRI